MASTREGERGELGARLPVGCAKAPENAQAPLTGSAFDSL